MLRLNWLLLNARSGVRTQATSNSRNGYYTLPNFTKYQSNTPKIFKDQIPPHFGYNNSKAILNYNPSIVDLRFKIFENLSLT